VHLVGDGKDTVNPSRCRREVGVGQRNAGPLAHSDGNGEAARDRQGNEQQRERYELDERAQDVGREAAAGLPMMTYATFVTTAVGFMTTSREGTANASKSCSRPSSLAEEAAYHTAVERLRDPNRTRAPPLSELVQMVRVAFLELDKVEARTTTKTSTIGLPELCNPPTKRRRRAS
jgi:hypothetical protein